MDLTITPARPQHVTRAQLDDLDARLGIGKLPQVKKARALLDRRDELNRYAAGLRADPTRDLARRWVAGEIDADELVAAAARAEAAADPKGYVQRALTTAAHAAEAAASQQLADIGETKWVEVLCAYVEPYVERAVTAAEAVPDHLVDPPESMLKGAERTAWHAYVGAVEQLRDALAVADRVRLAGWMPALPGEHHCESYRWRDPQVIGLWIARAPAVCYLRGFRAGHRPGVWTLADLAVAEPVPA